MGSASLEQSRHLKDGRARLVNHAGRLWWVKQGDRGRIPGSWNANEYIYLRVAEYARSYGLDLPMPEAVILPGGEVGIEYQGGLKYSLTELSARASSVRLNPNVLLAVAVFDAAMMNSDRLCSQVFLRSNAAWTFLDADQALFGNGGTDLVRFTRDLREHPHGDYIVDRHLYPPADSLQTRHAAVAALERIVKAWGDIAGVSAREANLAGLLPVEVWEKSATIERWFAELYTRVQTGIFLDPKTWQSKCRRGQHGAS